MKRGIGAGPKLLPPKLRSVTLRLCLNLDRHSKKTKTKQETRMKMHFYSYSCSYFISAYQVSCHESIPPSPLPRPASVICSFVWVPLSARFKSFTSRGRGISGSPSLFQLFRHFFFFFFF